MKRTCLTISITCMLCVFAQGLQSQTLRMVADINAANISTELVVTGRTVFNGKIHFVGNDGSRKTLYTLDGGGASMLLPQLDAMSAMHNGGSYLVFWADDGSHAGDEPWASDGTISGTSLLDNLNTLDPSMNASQLEGGYVAINGQSYFGAFESFRMKKNGSVWDFGLYRTDGTSSGTVEIYDDLDVQKMIELNGNLIIDALDMLNTGGYGRELFIHNGSSTVPIGTMTPGQWGMEDDNPYTQWYNRHVYAVHEPVVAANCAFFNSRSQYDGNELWCTDGSAIRMVTGVGNGAHSTYPVFMTPMDGVLYFVGLDTNNDSELWSFPLSDPMNTGTASVAVNINVTGSSEPCWLTVYDGDLYFTAYTEATGRELFRWDGSAVQLVADIASGAASSNPHYAPDISSALVGTRDYGTSERLCFTIFNGKLYFAADDGVHGYELWRYDAATALAELVSDVNSGAGGSDPHRLTVHNGKLYFTAYTPQFGRAWYEYDPGGSSVNQPPVAVANASPASGTAPLAVSFDGSGSSDPDGTIASYAWDFGDGSGASTQMNPSYTFSSPGTYSAQLTVTDNDNATATDNVTITVTSVPSGFMYVAAQTVTRVSLPGNKIAAEDVVLIKDDTGLPVSGALVTSVFAGPTSGSLSGTTDANGEVTLTSAWDRNPSGTWCFTVTDVQAAGKTYNAGANVVTTQCEGTPKKRLLSPTLCHLHQNYPNPFGSAVGQTDQTIIPYRLTEEMHVVLRVYNSLGQLQQTIFDGYQRAGVHTAVFQAEDLPSGTYWCLLTGAAEMQCIRMVLQK
mgnify:CR=1 FL=1